VTIHFTSKGTFNGDNNNKKKKSSITVIILAKKNNNHLYSSRSVFEDINGDWKVVVFVFLKKLFYLFLLKINFFIYFKLF